MVGGWLRAAEMAPQIKMLIELLNNTGNEPFFDPALKGRQMATHITDVNERTSRPPSVN